MTLITNILHIKNREQQKSFWEIVDIQISLSNYSLASIFLILTDEFAYIPERIDSRRPSVVAYWQISVNYL